MPASKVAPRMDHPVDFFLVKFVLNLLDSLQRKGFSRLPFQHEKTQRSDLEFFRGRVAHFRGRSQFTTQGVLNDGFQGRPPFGGNGLRFSEQRIVQIQSGFHGWVTIWFDGSLSS